MMSRLPAKRDRKIFVLYEGKKRGGEDPASLKLGGFATAEGRQQIL